MIIEKKKIEKVRRSNERYMHVMIEEKSSQYRRGELKATTSLLVPLFRKMKL